MRSTIVLALILGLCTGCSSCSGQKKAEEQQRQQAEDIIEANRRILEEEARLIDEYIEKHSLEMVKSRSGLRYAIQETGSGPKPTDGQVVLIDYESFFLDDSNLGPAGSSQMVIRVNQDYTIRGLVEGVQMMRVGDSAKFILPSHLAYGMQGVPGEIPRRATVIFDVTLTAINE